MTTLGYVFLAIYTVALLRGGPSALLAVLALSVSFNDSVVFAYGSLSLSPYYFGVILYLLSASSLVPNRRRHDRAIGRSWSTSFVLFFPMALAATLLETTAFSGIGVIAPSSGLDVGVADLTPLRFSNSNIAQLAYLALNTLMYLTVRSRKHEISNAFFSRAFKVGLTTALVGFAFNKPWPSSLFDNKPGGFYSIEQHRLRGQFSEPSHLGAFAAVAVIYFGAGWLRETGKRAGYNFVWLGISVTTLVLTGSGTGVVGISVSLAIIIALGAVRYATSRSSIDPRTFLGIIGLGALAAASFPFTAHYIRQLVSGKLVSASLQNRDLSNSNAISLFVHTKMLGVGLGSTSCSSMFLLILADVGIIGTTLFLLLTLSCIRRAMASRSSTPMAYALLTLTTICFISYADFASPLLWALIVACATVADHSRPLAHKERLIDVNVDVGNSLPAKIEHRRIPGWSAQRMQPVNVSQ